MGNLSKRCLVGQNQGGSEDKGLYQKLSTFNISKMSRFFKQSRKGVVRILGP